ncbi:LUD domain-containing protein [Streptomyces doebereineriae]|uniref:LUD domain-containing protein n=1 Tax=Streptomyces doebereineriae TaxID=3075528 RepID=A0ABU2VFE1_9ACTN|nr:LUD domain-containing protein [Streptomyces sp. DSM 41640]MDT0483939.1 LUD domain-containing protein [Streptomyces sp. DSM 41640]
MTAPAPVVDETFAKPADEAQLDRAAEALRDHNYIVHLVDTLTDARELVLALVARDQTVFTASSETLRLSGITEALDESGDFTSVRAASGNLGDDVYAQIRLGATPDVVVGSVHAVSEDGYLLVGSASGSQLAPYASGARKAIWVVGAQKIVPDMATGLRRIHDYSLPKEWRRLQETYAQTSFIGKILILEREAFPERGVVVLVRDTVGF